MTEFTSVFVPGKIYWAKIIGTKALHDNYDRDGRQWAYELAPDDTSFLKEHRLLDRLKDHEDKLNPDKGEFLTLKKPELNKDGDKNDPIAIYDSEKQPWSGKLIGNGSGVVAKLTIADFGKGKKKAIWTDAIMVTDFVPYEAPEGDDRPDRFDPFGSYGGSAPRGKTPKPKAKAKPQELDDLDDDVPF